MQMLEHVDTLSATAPLSQLSPLDRRELLALAAEAECVEDLPGKWQAAVLEAEQRAAGDEPAGGGHCCHGC
jgi:hypothetical protein